MDEKWIEVFKTGTHTDSSGNTKKWTTKDIDKIVSNYAARKDDSPAVIGHPKSNSPAYGWVMELKRDGDKLLAKVKPTVKEFVGWVNKKLYKYVSISLRPDLSLRHVGFLGGSPPAVKGLKVPEFTEEEFVEIEIEMSEIQTQEEIEMTATEAEKKQEQEFAELKKANENLKKANEKQSAEFKDLKKNFMASEEERKTAHENLKTLRLNMRKNEFEQFLNQGIAWGSVNEDQKATALKLLEVLGGEQFEEGGQEPEGVKLFKEFLKEFPEKVKPGEIATRQQAAKATEKSKEFEEMVTEYLKAHDDADYPEAVLAMAREHPMIYEAANG